MAYTTIDDPGLYFQTKLYTGNAGTQSITGVGLQPDLLWIKCRGATEIHTLVDSVRGDSGANTGYWYLSSADTSDDGSGSGNTLVSAIGSDGFSLGNNDRVNIAQPFVSWNWKAGTTASISGGSITPSALSINTTAGFGIYKWSGTGSAGTIAHGLGVVPKMIIVKALSGAPGGAQAWSVYHEALGATKILHLNTTAIESTQTDFNDTTPTSSVFSLGTANRTNASGGPYIGYAFADVQGYSKFGSYIGNGSSTGDGTFTYTGFAPKYIMVKRATGGVRNWHVFDTARDGGPGMINADIKPNLNSSGATASGVYWFDYLSNGFKVRMPTSNADYPDINNNGDTYIFMAFAEAPFVNSNGVPCNAQ